MQSTYFVWTHMHSPANRRLTDAQIQLEEKYTRACSNNYIFLHCPNLRLNDFNEKMSLFLSQAYCRTSAAKLRQVSAQVNAFVLLEFLTWIF